MNTVQMFSWSLNFNHRVIISLDARFLVIKICLLIWYLVIALGIYTLIAVIIKGLFAMPLVFNLLVSVFMIRAKVYRIH